MSSPSGSEDLVASEVICAFSGQGLVGTLAPDFFKEKDVSLYDKVLICLISLFAYRLSMIWASLEASSSSLWSHC